MRCTNETGKWRICVTQCGFFFFFMISWKHIPVITNARVNKIFSGQLGCFFTGCLSLSMVLKKTVRSQSVVIYSIYIFSVLCPVNPYTVYYILHIIIDHSIFLLSFSLWHLSQLHWKEKYFSTQPTVARRIRFTTHMPKRFQWFCLQANRKCSRIIRACDPDQG